jgi:hypothetical protein
MPGNSGSEDLVAGDSFGASEPLWNNPTWISLFMSFHRVDVLAIDANTREATLRLRHRAALLPIPEAIDPMALILSNAAYLIWAEAHHPHVPDIAEVQKTLLAVSTAELKGIFARAQTMTNHGKMVADAVTTILSQRDVGA